MCRLERTCLLHRLHAAPGLLVQQNLLILHKRWLLLLLLLLLVLKCEQLLQLLLIRWDALALWGCLLLGSCAGNWRGF